MSEIDQALFLDINTEGTDRPAGAATLETTHSRAMAAMEFSVQWQSEHARHTDRLIARKLNLWRDILPFEMEPELMDKPVGHTARHHFRAGSLIVPYQADMCFSVPNRAFNRQHRKHLNIEPRGGRFYPKGFLGGSRGIYPEDITPCRLGPVSDDMLTVDTNSPLAHRDLTVGVKILAIWESPEERGGSCNDVAESITQNGPGMQARWRDRPTDFWSDQPFDRFAAQPDAAFYALPRMASHVDRNASAQIRALYSQLLPAGGRVLDLMASFESHLPAGPYPDGVVGLGMNLEELDANPLFTERLVHDLNLDPRTDLESASFDAVVCSLSVEYLVQPWAIFAEVARLLKPGGRFICTFSNRWFQPKVTRVWEGAHEFERPAIVLEYFLRNGLFDQLETLSVRGLPRPADDRYAPGQADSDPLHAVWGSRV